MYTPLIIALFLLSSCTTSSKLAEGICRDKVSLNASQAEMDECIDKETQRIQEINRAYKRDDRECRSLAYRNYPDQFVTVYNCHDKNRNIIDVFESKRQAMIKKAKCNHITTSTADVTPSYVITDRARFIKTCLINKGWENGQNPLPRNFWPGLEIPNI